MKIFKYVLVGLFAIVFATACNQGIDPITAIDPGPDATAPVITIKYPTEGTKIQVPTLIASVNIQFEATDDIELKSVAILIDNVEIASFTTFKDYRRLVEEYLYNNVTNGAHKLTIKATDLNGKVTNTTVNFEKKPPYTPLYAGETFYMPFDGDFVEKISFKEATKVGSPVFAGEALKGTNAFMGATDSYLTFPLAGLTGEEFSAGFWYKANSNPDRAGIISISPGGEDRTKGLRFFREGSATSQRFKLNVGTGAGETWNDGDVIALPNSNWVHLAFTVSKTACVIYINGAVARSVPNTGINWTGCSTISIASGEPGFAYWNHKSDLSKFDEMRFFNKALTADEIQTIMQNDKPYTAKYAGEIFYMPFEGNYKELISKSDATKVGSPTFADGKLGKAYAGAADSHLTFPTTNLKNSTFSAVFWMKINATPDRAGILVMGPPDAAAPTAMNNRTSGFRFFRENAGGKQRFKLNAGNGTADSWFDGGAAADVDPTTGTWNHFAYTISGTECVVYINGEIAKQGTFGGIDWTGCDILSIMSGAPRFTGWSHFSDLSLMDELRIFNKALTQAEVKTIMNAEK
ncbi:MAG: LamG domain-containing protein [Prolixibacteraceae bacterium]|nr:LamG domain-containing protein [Prolixibacteraceae bacterium]